MSFLSDQTDLLITEPLKICLELETFNLIYDKLSDKIFHKQG